ncbi:hypothetical protein SBY92_001522 [Candida maltosa Xu316]
MTHISNTALLVLLILCLVFIVFLIFLFGYFCFSWCPFLLFGCSKRRRTHRAFKNFLETQVLAKELDTSIGLSDLENQPPTLERNIDAASNVALNSFPINSTQSTKNPQDGGGETDKPSVPLPVADDDDTTSNLIGGAAAAAAADAAVDSDIVTAARDITNGTSDSEFKSVPDTFGRENFFPPQKQGDSEIVQTLIAQPSDPMLNRCDSYSRTLLLQYIYDLSSKPNEQVIRKVGDPFSENFISIGEKVVVVQPFIGKTDREFSSLQTGDLLRIVQFYVGDGQEEDDITTESIKSIRKFSKKKSVEESNQTAEDKHVCKICENNTEITINREDPIHSKVVCTGILLDTYLDYDHNNHLNLKVKNESGNTDNENGELDVHDLIKEFPLHIVSLETTVVRTVLTGNDFGSDDDAI